MKKKLFMALVVMGMMTVSCTSVEDKAKGYAEDLEQAIKDGDTEKAAEITKEYQEWVEGLSPTEAAKAACYLH